MQTLIRFEDGRQDFLYWVVDEDGQVISCGPYQSSVWLGLQVKNLATLKAGGIVEYEGGTVQYRAEALMPLQPLETVVRLELGAYATATVRGKKASCTHSEDEAVRRLGAKLFGVYLDYVERVPSQDGDRANRIESRWRIVPLEVL